MDRTLTFDNRDGIRGNHVVLVRDGDYRELGGVSPTIVLPGRWKDADLRFQAEHVASQKLGNGGFT